MSDRPAYLDLGEADLTRWQADEVTKHFVAWIAHEGERARDEIAKNVALNAFENARIVSGRLSALGDILRAIQMPAPLPVVDEPDFRDPNERPRPRQVSP